MSQSGDYGIGEDGEMNPKPIDEIRSDLQTDFEKELGPDIELRPSSPLQDIINVFAIQIARTWDAAEGAYHAGSYEDAIGEQLDKLLSIANYERLPLQPATGEVTFSRESPATEEITIPSGTVVTTTRTQTQPPIPFETTDSAIIATNETEVQNVPIEALPPWQTEVDEQYLGDETNVPANSITNFETPVSGVDAVTNPNPTGDPNFGYQRGRDEETDAEFRLRYRSTFGSDGYATVNNIEASIFDADPGIQSVVVNEVRDSGAGDYGIEVTVLADSVDDSTIAEAIFFSRSAGVDTFGTNSADVIYEEQTYTEKFTHATQVDIHVDATLTTTDIYPADGDTHIQNNLVEYVGGTDSDGNEYPGLGIGEDVVFDQIKRSIMEVTGVVEADVALGTSSDPTGTSNIPVSDTEAARIADVTITMT